MTTFQSAVFVTHLEGKKSYLFKYVQTVCFKSFQTDSDMVKLLSSGFFGHEATVFTGTRLDMNTVSSGKSIYLNLHRHRCKDREHHEHYTFKLEKIFMPEYFI